MPTLLNQARLYQIYSGRDTGIIKGLIPLESSLSVLKLGIFCRLRQLNYDIKPLFFIKYLI